MKLPADFDEDERAFLQGRGAALHAATAKCPTPDQLHAALERVLPEDWQQQIDTHLATCRLCQTLAASLQSAEPEPLTALESRRIRSRLSLPPLPVISREKPKPWWSKWWAAAGLAAAGAAAAVTTFLATSPQEPPRKPEVAEVKPAAPQPQQQAVRLQPRIPLVAAPLRLPINALTMRGDEPSSTGQAYLQQLGHALKPYRAADYAAAAKALADLAAAHPKAPEPPFYEAVSLLFLDQPQEAAARLEHARTLTNEALSTEIPWYLAIAYERSGRGPQAHALLATICATPGPHRDEACKIKAR